MITNGLLFITFCFSIANARSCTFLTDDACDVDAILNSPCVTNGTFAQYLTWKSDLSQCDCDAYDANLPASQAEDNCALNLCPSYDAGCAIGCHDVYSAARSVISNAKCACYARANAKCIPSSTSNQSDSANTTAPGSPVDSNNASSQLPSLPPTSPGSVSPALPNPQAPQKCNFVYQPGSCPMNIVSHDCLTLGKALVQLSSPTTNGCGPAGNDFYASLLRLGLTAFAAEFQGACELHDQCFGTCSQGDDSLFDACNTQLRGRMLAICNTYSSVSVSPSALLSYLSGTDLHTFCIDRAEFIYGAIQETSYGCAAYDTSQNLACECVDCDLSVALGSRIAVEAPVDAVRSACTAASKLGSDWASFNLAVNRAITVANPADSSALKYYANAVGIGSPRVSLQVQNLNTICGQQTRRRSDSHVGRKRQSAIQLSSYFSSVGDTNPAAYGCTSLPSNQICATSNAIIYLAGLARSIESYADDSILPAASPSMAGSKM